jgi:hypothetical protein
MAWGKILLGLLVLLLLAAIGVLGWQLKLAMDQGAKSTVDKQSLQNQVTDLTKQLADAKKTASTSTVASAVSPCSTQAVITQALKDNLAAAIESKNTAALKGYMASQVNVVFAASEKAGKETLDQAIADLDYLNSNATAPWGFNLSAAMLSSFKAGFYKSYFDGVIYAGESSNKYVIVYHFDLCGRIDQIFVAASADLLV